MTVVSARFALALAGLSTVMLVSAPALSGSMGVVMSVAYAIGTLGLVMLLFRAGAAAGLAPRSLALGATLAFVPRAFSLSTQVLGVTWFDDPWIAHAGLACGVLGPALLAWAIVAQGTALPGPVAASDDASA